MPGRMTRPAVDLRAFSRRGYVPGASKLRRILWLVVEPVTMRNPLLVSYGLKVALLRLFGASIGQAVVVKPLVQVKYPWRLAIGDFAWIGEKAWIDNMEDVRIGAHVVISQGAYLCTGNHDWTDPGMGLTPRPICLEAGSWVGAFARLAPGVRVGSNAIVGLGAVLLADAKPDGIYQGNPAQRVGTRRLQRPNETNDA